MKIQVEYHQFVNKFNLHMIYDFCNIIYFTPYIISLSKVNFKNKYQEIYFIIIYKYEHLKY